MAFGVNRVGTQTRATFQQAGGTIIKFRHPYLTGAIQSTTGAITDIIDLSACMKLDADFFKAEPNQDSASQTVLINGDTITISNKMLNGTITLPLVQTTGLVGSGDAINAFQLIKSIGDNAGGLLYRTKFINGKAITRVYYGVSVQRVPDDENNGLNVAVYNTLLLYSGYIDAVSVSGSVNLKAIWAVGNDYGIEGYFEPYDLNADAASGSSALTSAVAQSGDDSFNDDTSTDDNIDNIDSDTDTSSTPANTTLGEDYSILS